MLFFMGNTAPLEAWEHEHKLLEELLSEARKRKSAGERMTTKTNDV